MNTAPGQYALAAAIQADYEARAAHHRMVKAHASESDQAPGGVRPRFWSRFRRSGTLVRHEGHVA